MKYLNDLVYDALKEKKNVSLFLCEDIEGGFGIKINGEVLIKNLEWEMIEVGMEEKEE